MFRKIKKVYQYVRIVDRLIVSYYKLYKEVRDENSSCESV